MPFSISAIYKSLVRHVLDTVEDVRDQGIAELEYWAWDSRGDENEPEAKDLIGIAGWTFTENGGLWVIHAGITISTINDENLFREAEIIDAIHNRFGEECLIPMRDPQTGQEYTQLVVKGFEMLPSGNSSKRNYRPIGLQLRRTDNA